MQQNREIKKFNNIIKTKKKWKNIHEQGNTKNNPIKSRCKNYIARISLRGLSDYQHADQEHWHSTCA